MTQQQPSSISPMVMDHRRSSSTSNPNSSSIIAPHSPPDPMLTTIQTLANKIVSEFNTLNTNDAYQVSLAYSNLKLTVLSYFVKEANAEKARLAKQELSIAETKELEKTYEASRAILLAVKQLLELSSRWALPTLEWWITVIEHVPDLPRVYCPNNTKLHEMMDNSAILAEFFSLLKSMCAVEDRPSPMSYSKRIFECINNIPISVATHVRKHYPRTLVTGCLYHHLEFFTKNDNLVLAHLTSPSMSYDASNDVVMMNFKTILGNLVTEYPQAMVESVRGLLKSYEMFMTTVIVNQQIVNSFNDPSFGYTPFILPFLVTMLLTFDFIPKVYADVLKDPTLPPLFMKMITFEETLKPSCFRNSMVSRNIIQFAPFFQPILISLFDTLKSRTASLYIPVVLTLEAIDHEITKSVLGHPDGIGTKVQDLLATLLDLPLQQKSSSIQTNITNLLTGPQTFQPQTEPNLISPDKAGIDLLKKRYSSRVRSLISAGARGKSSRIGVAESMEILNTILIMMMGAVHEQDQWVEVLFSVLTEVDLRGAQDGEVINVVLMEGVAEALDIACRMYGEEVTLKRFFKLVPDTIESNAFALSQQNNLLLNIVTLLRRSPTHWKYLVPLRKQLFKLLSATMDSVLKSFDSSNSESLSERRCKSRLLVYMLSFYFSGRPRSLPHPLKTSDEESKWLDVECERLGSIRHELTLLVACYFKLVKHYACGQDDLLEELVAFKSLFKDFIPKLSGPAVMMLIDIILEWVFEWRDKSSGSTITEDLEMDNGNQGLLNLNAQRNVGLATGEDITRKLVKGAKEKSRKSLLAIVDQGRFNQEIAQLIKTIFGASSPTQVNIQHTFNVKFAQKFNKYPPTLASQYLEYFPEVVWWSQTHTHIRCRVSWDRELWLCELFEKNGLLWDVLRVASTPILNSSSSSVSKQYLVPLTDLFYGLLAIFIGFWYHSSRRDNTKLKESFPKEYACTVTLLGILTNSIPNHFPSILSRGKVLTGLLPSCSGQEISTLLWKGLWLYLFANPFDNADDVVMGNGGEANGKTDDAEIRDLVSELLVSKGLKSCLNDIADGSLALTYSLRDR